MTTVKRDGSEKEPPKVTPQNQSVAALAFKQCKRGYFVDFTKLGREAFATSQSKVYSADHDHSNQKRPLNIHRMSAV